MKRIKITAICVSLLATLCMVGCISSPMHYHGMHNMHRGHISSFAVHNGCDPCGPAVGCGDVCGVGSGFSSGIMTSGRIYCPPRHTPVDCQSAFANITNGAFLTTRGILDLTAAPFVIIGNLLSHNYGYKVVPYCKDIPVTGISHQVISPCSSVSVSGCMPGCETCAGGFSEGIRYNVHPQHHSTILPPSVRRSHSVVQASYSEPITPGVRFIQPSRTVVR